VPGALVRLIPLSFAPPEDYDPSLGSGAPDFDNIAGRPAPEQVTRTDERGFYFFPDLPAGHYLVVVSANGYAPTEQETAVEEGVRAFLDLYLERIPTGIVFGRVTEATETSVAGAPIPGAFVHLCPVIPADDPVLPPQCLFTARTDENGEYQFPPLPCGPYTVRVRAYGFESFEGDLLVPEFERLRADYQLKPLSIEFGAVEGTVYAEPLTPDGPITPLEGATVLLVTAPMIMDGTPVPGDPGVPGGLDYGSIIRRATSAADGSYRFGGVIPGDYVVVAKKAGFYPQRQVVAVLPGETSTLDFLLTRWVEPEFGAVEGHVLEDPGMLTIVPPPIPGALVIIEPWNFIDPTRFHSTDPMNDPNQGDAEPVFPRRTITDETGYYRFDRLPPGEYRLRVFAEGFAPGVQDAKVGPNQTTTLDFLLVRVPDEPGRVLGTVFEIPAPDDPSLGLPVPVAGAKVTLYPIWSDVGSLFDDAGSAAGLPLPEDYPGTGILVAFTNDMGYYEFPQVPSGAYRVEAQAGGLQPEAHMIRVQPREVIVQDFYLHPAPLEPFGSVGGQVLAATDFTVADPWPIPGAYVFLIPANTILPGDPSTGDLPPGTQVRTTDQEGRYFFERVPAGPYSIVVYARGYEPGVREVQVPPGETIRVNFFLVPAGPVPPSAFSGMVLEAGTDPAFAPVPIAGATVTAVPDWPGDLLRPVPLYEAVTDDQGRFGFPELPPGEYIVHVRAEGYAEVRDRFVLPPGIEVHRTFYMLPLNMEPAALHGYVRTATSTAGEQTPIVGADVVLVMMNVINGTNYMLPGMYRTVTDENGFYRFEGLKPTMYHVSVSAAGFEPFSGQIDLPPGADIQQDYYLRPSTTRPGRVCGTVMSPTGPIAGARVVIPLPGLLLSAETDEAGAFCITGVPSGLHRIKAEKQGYISQSLDIFVPSGGEATVDFLLDPVPVSGTAAFSGLVLSPTQPATGTDPPLIPVEGAMVRLSLVDPPTFAPVIYEATTAADGSFRFDEIFAPGLYAVTVAARGCGTIQDQLAVGAGEEAYREFVLDCFIPGPAKMEGRVSADIPGWVGPLLPPIPGALVRLVPTFDVAPVPLYEATTDEMGHYAIGGIQPGLYNVSVTAEGFEPAAGMVNLDPGQIVVRNFDLKPLDVVPGSVSGRVILNTTYRVIAPIPDAQLTLLSGETAIASATSDQEGFFTMDNVPAGSYVLHAEARGHFPENRPVNVLPDENTDVLFRLLRLTTHVGEVRGVAYWLIENSTSELPEPGTLPLPVAHQPVRLISIEYSFQEDYPPILLEGMTSAAGEFHFPVVPAGRYTLSIGWSGSGAHNQEIGVTEGGPTTVTVEVPPPAAILGSLSGRVLAGNNTAPKPVVGALVRLVPDGVVLPAIFPPPSFGLDAVSGPDGSYLIGRIPPGVYNAVVIAEGYSPGHATLGFGPGEEKRHNFLLSLVEPPPLFGMVRGTVSEYTGSLDIFIPIADALVTLTGPDGLARTAMTDTGGQYVIPGVPAGPYHIMAEHPDYIPGDKDVEVPPGDEVWANFSLHPVDVGIPLAQ
jgi:protocatechuate 3,4-dioxygenase beta subunit